MHVYYHLLAVTIILREPREGVTVDEGAGVATFCTIIDSLEEDDFPTERHIFYTIRTENSKITAKHTGHYLRNLLTDSAISGLDYLGVDTLLVTLPPGIFEGHIECTNISIIDDDLFEQQEMFTVNLDYTQNPSQFIGDSMGTISIVENDGEL